MILLGYRATVDIDTDRNGFSVCRECGADNGGMGAVTHEQGCLSPDNQ